VDEAEGVLRALIEGTTADIDAALAELLGGRPAWQARALCRAVGVDIFFKGAGESTDQARALCAACPTRAECLAAALEDVDTRGIWGGTSERQRREMRRTVA
jgi:WhiB family redox-sensing transcriptional regulator